MKLLFDQNLSHKLPRRLSDLFPGSTHVRDSDLKDADDPVIWDFAKRSEFTIVSKDLDMHQRSLVFGFPPKLIWVRLGNCSTTDVERLLRRHAEAIERFHTDPEASFLTLS
ncbi:MAG: DUF5615 family PIN-like protein [Ignavibacteriae bacterium]|nr:DUF5615 family PIN-like protein [Ignavibacteriota bacterium]